MLALLQSDRHVAQEALADAVTKSNKLLKLCNRNYGAFDTKGFALCGLALCEENPVHITKAIKAYRAARAINRDAGYLAQNLRLFDQLAKADSESVLKNVRLAASGE